MGILSKPFLLSLLLGGFATSQIVYSAELSEKEKKECTQRVISRIKITSTCSFGADTVNAAASKALEDSTSQDSISCSDDRIIIVTCVDFDSVNREASNGEILLDSNLDAANAVHCLAQKIVEQLESAKVLSKK